MTKNSRTDEELWQAIQDIDRDLLDPATPSTVVDEALSDMGLDPATVRAKDRDLVHALLEKRYAHTALASRDRPAELTAQGPAHALAFRHVAQEEIAMSFEAELLANGLTRDLHAAYRCYLFGVLALAQTVWTLGGVTLRCSKGADWSQVIEMLDVAEQAGFVRFTIRGRTVTIDPGDVEPALALPGLFQALGALSPPLWQTLVLGGGVAALLRLLQLRHVESRAGGGPTTA